MPSVQWSPLVPSANHRSFRDNLFVENDVQSPRRLGPWFWFKFVLGLALLALAGVKLHDLYQDWLANPQQVTFDGYAFALSATVYFAALLLTFYRWFVLVHALELPFGFGDSLRLGFVGFVSSLLAPGSVTGDLVKMGFIATEQKRRAAAIATIVADRLIGLYALFLVSAILGAIFWREAWPNDWLRRMLLLIWGVTGGGGVGLLILLYVPHPFDWLVPRLGRFAKIARMLAELAEALQQYRYRPLTLAWALFLGMLGHAGFVLSFYLCAVALRGPVAPPPLYLHFLFIPIGMVFQAVPLTPGGNAGANENFFDWLYKLVDPNFKLGVLITLLQRAVTWTVGLLGLVWYIPLRQKTKRAKAQAAMQAAEVAVEPVPPSPLATQEAPHETVS